MPTRARINTLAIAVFLVLVYALFAMFVFAVNMAVTLLVPSDASRVTVVMLAWALALVLAIGALSAVVFAARLPGEVSRSTIAVIALALPFMIGLGWLAFGYGTFVHCCEFGQDPFNATRCGCG